MKLVEYYNFMHNGIFQFFPPRFHWTHDGVVFHNGVEKKSIGFNFFATIFGFGVCIFEKYDANGLPRFWRGRPVKGVLIGFLRLNERRGLHLATGRNGRTPHPTSRGGYLS